MAKIGFNANEVEPSTPFELLPVGKYLAVAVASEMKPTKTGGGEYLQLTFEIVEGEHKGRKIFERLNIRNSNKQAEDIAMRALSALCRATGVMELEDSEQLHDIPVVLDIGTEAGKGEYGPQNRIKGYSAAGGAAPQPAARPAYQAPRTQPATAAAPANIPPPSYQAPQQTAMDMQPRGVSNKPAWKR